MPLVVCLVVIFVLSAGFLVLLYKWLDAKKSRTSKVGHVEVILLQFLCWCVILRARHVSVQNTKHRLIDIYLQLCVTQETSSPVSKCEDSTYQTLNLASMDQDQTYSNLLC